MAEIEVGAFIWDSSLAQAGQIDSISAEGVVHYRVMQMGVARPRSAWSDPSDLTVIAPPMAPSRTTVMQRFVWDLVENTEGAFRYEGEELVWIDTDGSAYRLDISGVIPGLSEEQRRL